VKTSQVASTAVIKSYLLAPGPTPVPPEVLAAVSLPVVHFGATVELGRGIGAAEAVLAGGLPAR
jgi:aspartate aminotransferase-like enzyme